MSPRRRTKTRYDAPSPPEHEPASPPAVPLEFAPPEEMSSEADDGTRSRDNGAPAAVEPMPEAPVEGEPRAGSETLPEADEAAAPDPGRAPEGTSQDVAAGIPAQPAALPAGVEVEGVAQAKATEPARHRLAAFLTVTGLALVAFITGLALFNSLVMPRLIHGVGTVYVPDLTNLTVDQAEQSLRGAGLQLSRAGERFDPSVPRGFVLSQDPGPGTAVRGRKRVSVVTSLGEEFSSVPELFGESQRSAEALLKSAGLRLGAITRAPSEAVGEGLIAGSDPSPEIVVPRDTPVSLLISSGTEEESFVMPELAGREIGGVRRQLESLGFDVVTPPGTASIGTIVGQSPAAGSRITLATRITLQATGRVIR